MTCGEKNPRVVQKWDRETKQTTRPLTTGPLTKGEAERVGVAVRSFEQPPSRRRFGEPREIAETAEIGGLAERVVTRSVVSWVVGEVARFPFRFPADPRRGWGWETAARGRRTSDGERGASERSGFAEAGQGLGDVGKAAVFRGGKSQVIV